MNDKISGRVINRQTSEWKTEIVNTETKKIE